MKYCSFSANFVFAYLYEGEKSFSQKMSVYSRRNGPFKHDEKQQLNLYLSKFDVGIEIFFSFQTLYTNNIYLSYKLIEFSINNTNIIINHSLVVFIPTVL